MTSRGAGSAERVVGNKRDRRGRSWPPTSRPERAAAPARGSTATSHAHPGRSACLQTEKGTGTGRRQIETMERVHCSRGTTPAEQTGGGMRIHPMRWKSLVYGSPKQRKRGTPINNSNRKKSTHKGKGRKRRGKRPTCHARSFPLVQRFQRACVVAQFGRRFHQLQALGAQVPLPQETGVGAEERGAQRRHRQPARW